MGLINCDKHDQQGIVHLCPHIHEQFKRGVIDSIYQIKKDETGITMYLCENCLKKYNLENIEILGFDELQEVGDDLWPVCTKCMTNILNS